MAAMASVAGTGSARPHALAGLLFFSGAAALAGEVVWARMLADVFGTTAGAVAVALACFMAGMGAGGLVLGRLADRVRRTLRLYGILEVAAGLLACLVPALVWLSGYVYGWIFRAAGPDSTCVLTAAKVVLSSAALVPPAFALGGTLPVLVRHAAGTRERTGFEMGRLYAANTAGAVVGCFAAGFLLIPGLGVLGTVFLGAALSLAVGATALFLSARVERDVLTARAENPTAGIPAWRRWAVPAVYGASGFAALGCEVLWTRSLVFILRSTVYAFTSMLTVFLVGLAAGGAAGSRVARRTRRPAAWFAGLEASLAVSVGCSLLVLRLFAADWTAVDLALASGWTASVLLHLLISAAVMLAPTFLLGMLFPVAGRLHSEAAPAGRATGELLFGNTLGGAAGSLAAGFCLIPLLGTAHSILALACVNLLVAAVVVSLFARVPRALRLRALLGAGVIILALFLAVPSSALRMLFAAPNPKAKLVFVDEGPGGVVTVHRYPVSGHRLLSVGGIPVAGTAPPLRSTQILQGLIPTLLHPSPESVLQIGLGSGETARVTLSTGAERYTCVEICPGIVRAAREYFEDVNERVLDEPRFRVITADGKNFLRHTRRRYDLILSESTYPFLRGSSGLYTFEYFRDCRARLAPRGIVSCWFPLDVPERGLKSILRTFTDVFPHATLWTTNLYGYKHALLLGSDEPIEIRFAELDRRMQDTRAGALLKSVEIGSAGEFASCLMLDRKGMLAYAGDAPLHTDNHPVLEYATSLRAALPWQARLASNVEAMSRHRASLLDHVPLPPGASEKAATYVRYLERKADERIADLVRLLRAKAQLTEARRAVKRGKGEEAVKLYRQALEFDAADREALNELGMLYLELGRLEDARELEKAARNGGAGRND